VSQCCAALLNLHFLDLSLHYALACSRKFGDLLMNDTEALTKILRDYGVSTIVCGRFLNYKYVEKLVHIIRDDIQVYPPLSAQIRTLEPPEVLFLTSERLVMARMTYVVRITTVMNRNESKFVTILFQTFKKCGDAVSQRYYSEDYFIDDARSISTNIIQREKMSEFRIDYKVKKELNCYSGLVVMLGFATLNPDPPHKYSESEDNWNLEYVKTWLTCDIDFPDDNVKTGHGFHGVVGNLGLALFEYITLYGTKGRTPV
jgi:hypothetical protein